jgi:hypothetical protein
MRKERRSIMENRRKQGWLVAILALAFLAVGVAALGAQEGPPPPPEGLVFSGSVITGVRWRSYVPVGAPGSVAGNNRFDIDAGDDFLSSGDTAALRAALNKGFYGANFGMALNANNTDDGFWVTDKYVYVNEASLWAKFLENKIGVKAGYYGDFDYFTPVNVWSLGANSAVQLTFAPIQGLQIDVKSRLSPANNFFGTWSEPTWYEGEQWARNVDLGVKYSNPTFTAFVVFDDDWTKGTAAVPAKVEFDTLGPNPLRPIYTAAVPAGDPTTQIDVFAYFGWTGTPKLTATVETKFLDLTSERAHPIDVGEDYGITNVTGVQVGYQITDALFARAFFLLGGLAPGFPAGFAVGAGAAKPLLGEDGFSFAVDIEASYKLNDSFTFYLKPAFQIPDTDPAVGDVWFDFGVRPKVAWTVAPGPYAATINFSYWLKVFGEDGYAYNNNDQEALHHTAAVTFGWNF